MDAAAATAKIDAQEHANEAVVENGDTAEGDGGGTFKYCLTSQYYPHSEYS